MDPSQALGPLFNPQPLCVNLHRLIFNHTVPHSLRLSRRTCTHMNDLLLHLAATNPIKYVSGFPAVLFADHREQEVASLWRSKQHKDVILQIVIPEMLEANPTVLKMRLTRGLSFNDDGSLHSWNLSFCELKILPDSFGHVRYTGSLDLSTNLLEHLPQTFCGVLTGGDLILTSNKLKDLPELFGRVTVGGNLALASNQLQHLPESFGRMIVPGNLDCTGNKLLDLPESFCGVKVGGDIILESNQLQDLPESIGGLCVGGGLYLDDNKLEHLPASFVNIRVGGDLTLCDNLIGGIPQCPEVEGEVIMEMSDTENYDY